MSNRRSEYKKGELPQERIDARFEKGSLVHYRAVGELVAAADAPGVVGEFWLTVSAKNCRLNPCSASRPTSEDADDMMQERARRGYRR